MMRAVFFAVVLAAALGAGAAAQSSPGGSPPVAAASPQPSPTPAYRYIWLPTPSPDAPPPSVGLHGPEIREIDLGDQTLVTPGELRVRVKTNRDVVSVIARTLGREIGIPRSDSGLFELSGMVPQVPKFLSGRTFDVDFVAATSDGRTAVVTLPLGLI